MTVKENTNLENTCIIRNREFKRWVTVPVACPCRNQTDAMRHYGKHVKEQVEIYHKIVDDSTKVCLIGATNLHTDNTPSYVVGQRRDRQFYKSAHYHASKKRKLNEIPAVDDSVPSIIDI